MLIKFGSSTKKCLAFYKEQTNKLLPIDMNVCEYTH